MIRRSMEQIYYDINKEDKMKVNIVDYSKNGEETIAQASGICYGKPDKDISRITRLKKHKHLATMRFAHAVILVENISRSCQNQLVRSKHLDFLVESQRYVNQSDRGFVMPECTDIAKDMINQHVKSSHDLYYDLVQSGMAKEDARAVLPLNTMTSMYVAGNIQAWMDYLYLRVSKHAQEEIRLVSISIWAILMSVYPAVFTDLVFDNKTFEEWGDYEN